ncbi:MAG: hypothetical protein ACKO1F_00200 [Flammeovirgaceae bacterium]
MDDWELDNLLQIFFASVGLSFNLLLIHASCILIDNEAVLFTAPSGSGKSTIAKLSEKEIIHDDLVALTYNEAQGNFLIQSIPFKVPYLKKAFYGKIKGFFRIYKSTETYIEDINDVEQYSQLLASVWSFSEFDGTNKKSYNGAVVEYCEHIKNAVPLKNLYFTKSNDFLNLIK